MKVNRVLQILNKYSSEKKGDYTIFNAVNLHKAAGIISNESEHPAIYKVFDELHTEYTLEEIACYHAEWENEARL